MRIYLTVMLQVYYFSGLFVESCRTLFLVKQPSLHYTITKHFISVSLFDMFGALPTPEISCFSHITAGGFLSRMYPGKHPAGFFTKEPSGGESYEYL